LAVSVKETDRRSDEKAFQDFPDDLEALYELLQDVRARLDVCLDTDAHVLIDYEQRAQEVVTPLTLLVIIISR
jgi:hypothetical protein